MVLLNCADPHEQDALTAQWRDHKLNELSFIGVVVRHFHAPLRNLPIPN